MGAAAWSISQVNGNVIDGDGAAAAGVNGGADELGLGEGEGGSVTKSLYAGLKCRIDREVRVPR